MFRPVLAAALALAAGTAAAAPRVAADIAPVHSLVAAVMQGVAEPALILPPGASPHGHAMRPSEARALQEAELVFWIGPQLAPWLDGPIDALAGRATAVALRDAPGVTLLPVREGATFAAHDHGDQGHRHGDGHGHDHGAEAHGHDHGAEPVDEHVWLDPENAKLWLGVIAEALSQADPANAATYAANAAAAAAEIDAASADAAARLRRVRGLPFVVFHDAYQYFEARFGIPAAGSVTVSDAAPPGAARMAEIRRVLLAAEAACIFAEPQFPARVVDAVAEGTGARAGVLDPLGARLTPGPALYPAILRGLADALAGCLAP